MSSAWPADYPKRIVWFDLETTGLDPAKADTIQIAAIATGPLTTDFSVMDELEVKLKPSEEALKDLWQGSIYNPEVWGQVQVSQEEGWTKFVAFIKKHACMGRRSKLGRSYNVAQLAGYNVAFDMRFIEFAKVKHSLWVPADLRAIDVLPLALFYGRVLDKATFKDYTLSTVAEVLGCPLGEAAHEALADVRATIAVARALARRAPMEYLQGTFYLVGKE